MLKTFSEESSKKPYFYKRILTSGCSLEALQWISFMQQTCDDLVDADGNRAMVEHKYYRGEKSFKGKDIDGYALVGSKHVFLEYLGCYWHQCPIPGCKEPRRKDLEGDIDIAFEEKREFLSQFGKVISIHGCEWKRQKKSMSLRNFPTNDLPLVMNNYGNEETIVNGIRNGQLFGFVVCDVSTPDALLEDILPINFPPIITRGEINETHLSDYMKTRVEDRGYKLPQTTLIQQYNAKQVLLYTPMVEFYLNLGMRITNVTRFLQYQPAVVLKPFAEKITTGRIAANKAGNESLELAYKIIGNR